jgi:alkyl hydroperoxide reductase subunit AhpC
LSKRYLWLLGLVLIISLAYIARAEKLIVTKHDDFLDTDVNFFDANGNKVYLDQYEGNTILLVFWATWCGSCVGELPSLDNLQKDFRKLPFKIIAVSEDYQGIEIVKKYFSENEIRHLEIFHDYQNNLFRSLAIVGLPTAYLINAEGKVKYIFNGVVKWHDNEVRQMIMAQIDGNQALPKNTFKSASLNKQVVKAKKTVVEVTAEEVKNDNQEVKDEEISSKKQE